MAREKTSETRFLLEILTILVMLIPSVFIRKARSTLQNSWKRTRNFIWEEKATATLILIITITSVIGWFLPEQVIDALVQRPTDLLSLKAYTLLTAGFLHANITHLAGNMLALLIFGRQVEQKLRPKKLIMSYFAALIISGTISSIANILIGDNTPGIGASGAIMGVVALAMLIKPLTITYILIVPLPIAAVGWLFIIADITGLLGPSDGIGHFAHLGGFMSVAIITYLLSKDERRNMRKGALICLGTLLVMAAIRAAM